MSSQEFTQWLIYDSIEPIGERREDFRVALLMQTIIAPHTKNTPSVGMIMESFDFWRKREKPKAPSPEAESAAIKRVLGIGPDNKPLNKEVKVRVLGPDGNPIS